MSALRERITYDLNIPFLSVCFVIQVCIVNRIHIVCFGFKDLCVHGEIVCSVFAECFVSY